LLLLVSAALGYVIGEPLFYFVAAGSLWRVVVALVARRRPKEVVTLGLEQRVPVPGSVPSVPEDLAATRHESHGIAAYYLAVLTALGLLLWLLPGHGSAVR